MQNLFYLFFLGIAEETEIILANHDKPFIVENKTLVHNDTDHDPARDLVEKSISKTQNEEESVYRDEVLDQTLDELRKANKSFDKPQFSLYELPWFLEYANVFKR